jgi:hypothetical protein
MLLIALLIWAQTTVQAVIQPPRCQAAAIDSCAAACGTCGCCAHQPLPDSKPAPTVPAQSKTPSQMVFLALTLMAAQPETTPTDSTFASLSLPTAASAPLYARHCALLL